MDEVNSDQILTRLGAGALRERLQRHRTDTVLLPDVQFLPHAGENAAPTPVGRAEPMAHRSFPAVAREEQTLQRHAGSAAFVQSDPLP